MAVEPIRKARADCSLRLDSFDPALADVVASWVRDEHEARLLAPATRPPLTARRVLDWAGPGREPLSLWEPDVAGPIGYGELNVLHNRRREFWLGHLIVDPVHRGRGFGTWLTRLLLRRAFSRKNARRVTLVVVPENEPAIASYRAAGMRPDGHETHAFPASDDRIRLLRMVATRLP